MSCSFTSGKYFWLGVLAIAVALLLIYGPHLGNGFIYDDHSQIEQNPYLGEDVSWLEPFRHDVWGHTLSTNIGEILPYYRPLLYVVYRLAHLLGGGASWAYHLLSLLLHGACVGLAWLALTRLGMRRGLALAAAGIFALHPLAAEQVYYAANITEILLLAGMLLALVGVLAAHETAGVKRCLWLAAASLAVAVALFSKETALVIPMLLTVEALRGQRSAWRRRLADVFPLWLVPCLYLGVRSAVLGGMPLSGWEPFDAEHFGKAGFALLWYVSQFLVPYPLTPSHTIPSGAWLVPLGLLTLVVFLALVLFLVRYRQGSPFWIAWLFLPLLPPLSLFFREHQPLSSMLADHNLYCSLVPGAALLVSGGSRFLQQRVSPRNYTCLATALLVVAGLAGGMTSHFYGRIFASDELLFENALRLDPDNITALNAAASTRRMNNQDEEALALLQRALEVEPKVGKTHYSLGVTLLKMNRPAEAAVHLQQVLVLVGPSRLTYELLADALRKAGNLRGASFYYQEALSLDPSRTATRVNLGLSLYHLGNATEAIHHLQQALAEVPDQEAALFNLGMIYRQTGDQRLAVEYLRRFLAVSKPEAAERRTQAALWLAELAQGQ